MCTISGLRHDRPVPGPASHGIAYDAWAGMVAPEPDAERASRHPRPRLDRHQRRPAVRRARRSSPRSSGPARPARAASSSSRSPTPPPRSTGTAARRYRAYERPEAEVTGNTSDDYERRAPGTAGMADGVRYQFYESPRRPRPVHGLRAGVLEKLLPRPSAAPTCSSAGPGSQYADHARGNIELQPRAHATIFRQRTTAEWIEFGDRDQRADRAR